MKEKKHPVFYICSLWFFYTVYDYCLKPENLCYRHRQKKMVSSCIAPVAPYSNWSCTAAATTTTMYDKLAMFGLDTVMIELVFYHWNSSIEKKSKEKNKKFENIVTRLTRQFVEHLWFLFIALRIKMGLLNSTISNISYFLITFLRKIGYYYFSPHIFGPKTEIQWENSK